MGAIHGRGYYDGLDLAKHVFQVHGVDAEGATVLRKQLRRAQVLGFFSRLPPCLVGLEACATAHYWARELHALGHEVRLMPAQYVKAYIKRNKHDAADAEAICEPVVRPTMRFVPGKTADQQAAVLLHRGREPPAPNSVAGLSLVWYSPARSLFNFGPAQIKQCPQDDRNDWPLRVSRIGCHIGFDMPDKKGIG
jgi:hypothetical protein